MAARNTNEEPLSSVMLKLIDAYGFADKLDERKALSAWSIVVGESIAKQTSDLYVHKRKLFVTINYAALKSELLFAKSRLLQSINKEIGKDFLQDIVIR